MIKHLHSKNTTSRPNVRKKLNPEMTMKQMLQEISSDLMKPREQSVMAILNQAKAMNLV